LAYSIVYHEDVTGDLNKLSRKEASRIINKIETVLPERANSFPQLKGKFSGLRKFRIGNYRVIFEIAGNEVIVLRVGHRKGVYRSILPIKAVSEFVSNSTLFLSQISTTEHIIKSYHIIGNPCKMKLVLNSMLFNAT
jgi:mRNA interferase RelE/StbE